MKDKGRRDALRDIPQPRIVRLAAFLHKPVRIPDRDRKRINARCGDKFLRLRRIGHILLPRHMLRINLPDIRHVAKFGLNDDGPLMTILRDLFCHGVVIRIRPP